jgi:hypothetical protein
VAKQAKDKAQQLASQAQEQTTKQVESGLAKGKNQAAETLSGVAQSLRFSSQQLREQNQGGVSRYTERAADQVERLSNYLQSADATEIVDRVEDFARRQPALFLGGAFTLGLLGARFLKSSRRREGQTVGAGYWSAGAPAGRAYVGERDVTDLRGGVGRAPRGEWATPAVGTVRPTEPDRPVQPGFAPPFSEPGYAASPPGQEGTERL